MKMNKKLLATLIALAYASPALSAESCTADTLCAAPEKPGKTERSSRVLQRGAGWTPPSVEYRRPDEVVIIAAPAEAVTESVPAAATPLPPMENRAEPQPLVMPNFASGLKQLTPQELETVTLLARRLAEKQNLRLRITGHADIQRLSARAQKIYGDNMGLSIARAEEVAALLKSQPGLAAVPMEIQGKGDSEQVKACDPKRAYAGNSADMAEYQACLAPNRRVEIEIWYDQPAAAPVAEAPAATPPVAAPEPQPEMAKPDCKDQNGGDAGLPFRISVDGEPLALEDLPNTADTTRCSDIALEKADIQIRFDGLESTPILNVTAHPDGAVRGEAIHFTPYSNYSAFIHRAELRLFAATGSVLKRPLSVIELDPAMNRPIALAFPRESGLEAIQYVLRVYDAQGRFDETTPKPLRLSDKNRPLGDEQEAAREALIGYGENHRSLKNIPVSGGAVTVNGEKLAPGSTVEVLGRAGGRQRQVRRAPDPAAGQPCGERGDAEPRGGARRVQTPPLHPHR